MENYIRITQLRQQPADYQVALLLHTVGDDALRIYDVFTFDTDNDARSVDEILVKFDNFAVGEANGCYERVIFNKRNQQQGDAFEQFLTAIKVLIKSCKFSSNSILRDIFVLGVQDRDLQEALLKERNISLESTIDTCRAADNASL